eukprot:TRINITY_DN26721_c0_g1_i1.p2 TRINITY_DN26721_c0_g1~~TRINITY_DN26721_c0_g1_i1.p2  ORF type:complete len:322 (+),score=85.28 TRINITY_DN26721_c0_g1_i1:74-1039(+)
MVKGGAEAGAAPSKRAANRAAQQQQKAKQRKRARRREAAAAQHHAESAKTVNLRALITADAVALMAYDWDEWLAVRRNLFSSDETVARAALSVVDQWRRSLGTNVAVDGTAMLVAAKLADHAAARCDPHALTESELLNIYAFAVVRLVNGITGELEHSVHSHKHHKTHLTVKELAQLADMPMELVDLRMAATHKRLPSIEEMRIGCALALDWLELKYWEPQQQQLLQWHHLRSADSCAEPAPAPSRRAVVHPYLQGPLPRQAAAQAGFFSTRLLGELSEELTRMEKSLGLEEGHEQQLRWAPAGRTVADLQEASKRAAAPR